MYWGPFGGGEHEGGPGWRYCNPKMFPWPKDRDYSTNDLNPPIGLYGFMKGDNGSATLRPPEYVEFGMIYNRQHTYVRYDMADADGGWCSIDTGDEQYPVVYTNPHHDNIRLVRHKYEYVEEW